MGFAGQIFAARVAVGLAVPSPQAFSEAGATVGKFAAKMYQKLNNQAANASKKRVEQAKANANAAKSVMETHAKSQDKTIEQAMQSSIRRVQNAMMGLKKSSAGAGVVIKGLKTQMGKTKLRGKLFPNSAKDMGDAKQYMALLKNFITLGQKEQKEIIKTAKARVLEIDKLTATKAKRKKYSVAKLKELQDERKEQGLLAKQLEVVMGDRKEAIKTHAKEHARYVRNYKKLNDKELEAMKKNEQMLIKLKKEQLAWARSVGKTVGKLKTGFSNALRESISVLTAFYYKLNQNTQELIAFERELKNANSVFRLTNDELFNVGETVIQFGQKFGMEMQNGAQGLYQLASAGVTAEEALQILPETLKLSMAVQGDHNTISKLTAQTLFGFGMEMSQAAEITDKFAWAIQKSLIEYEDLSSAIKFALPFFTTTGQSIDQLLGALAVLTNRALEAGIAGRGLRQGLAELAESVGDNTAAFRKLGIEVTNQQGDLLQLTEIAANFAATLEEGVINDTELLTMLIQDLNVRGATAFVHLVQASDEFTLAVESSANAAGELDQMVKEQNTSMGAQIQILKNNVQAIFMHRDATYQGTEYMNAFHEATTKGIASLQGLIMVETESGFVMTALGRQIQEIAVTGVQMLVQVVEKIIPLIEKFTKSGGINVQLLKIYLIPLMMVVKFVELLGPHTIKLALAYHMLNKTLGLSVLLTNAWTAAETAWLYLSTKSLVILGFRETMITRLEVAGRKELRIKHMRNRLTTKQIIQDTYNLWLGKQTLRQKISTIAWDALETVGKWALWVATTALAAAQWLLFSPWGLLIIAGVMLAAVTAKLIKRFFDWNDIMHAFTVTLTHVKNFIMWFGTAAYTMFVKPFVDVADTIASSLENEFFALIIFFKHFFGFMKWGWGELSKALEPVVMFIGSVLKFFITVANPLALFIRGLIIINKELRVMERISRGLQAVGGFIKGLFGAEGMAISSPRYAAQGALAGGPLPYIVGERGPELFMPRTQGRIYPNKDLNTQRVKNMLQDAFDVAPRMGAAGITQANTLIVSSLNVGSADIRKTKLGVDVFG